MISAPKLDWLLKMFDNKNYNPRGYNEFIKDKINELYDLLDTIKPLDSDEYKVLYFSVPRGTIEEYGDYEDLKADGIVENYQEFNRIFNEDYPDDYYWYKMTSSKYKNYRAIFINSKNVIYADMDDNKRYFEDYELQGLLEFLIYKVKECIKMLKNNTYNDYINSNYDYKNRFGIIKRKKLWELYPQIKENFFSEITQEEINYFIKNAKETVSNRIKKMTSNKYFECVGLAYKNIGYEIDNLTNKELYLKYADGRDEGLSEIKDNSSRAFNKWYNDKKIGGHPWEIIIGHSFSRVNLYVSYDKNGYYLSLDGTIILRKIEIVKIFNILNKNNIPIKIYNVDIIKKALIGDDFIGVVPNYILPIQCGSYFKKGNPLEFMRLENEKMCKYIKWEPLENIELKDNKNI